MRRGCKFCTFLLHGLKHKCRLETLRKIEARLDKFSDGSECAMFVEYRRVNMTYRQIIRLSLPRKSCQSAHNAGGWQLFISSWLRDRPSKFKVCLFQAISQANADRQLYITERLETLSM